VANAAASVGSRALHNSGSYRVLKTKYFGAITAVMAAVADLTEAARRRVVNYALQRLSEEHPDAPHFEHTSRARELLSNS
jgi:hypothetical protein